jgi:acyl carrier protein
MARGRPIRPEDDLEAAGVDSMGLLRVLVFVEAELGFWMPDEDLVEENICSARALASYICRRGPSYDSTPVLASFRRAAGQSIMTGRISGQPAGDSDRPRSVDEVEAARRRGSHRRGTAWVSAP